MRSDTSLWLEPIATTVSLVSLTLHLCRTNVYPGERDEEEEERAPFSGATTTSTLSVSARLAMAERELAEVTAQRDAAMELLESSRLENARLSAELDRAKSYKALYAAAHHVRCVCLA